MDYLPKKSILPIPMENRIDFISKSVARNKADHLIMKEIAAIDIYFKVHISMFYNYELTQGEIDSIK